MLPFRLKPPSYGGKLKKEKQEQASPLDRNHFLRDGGPLQRAIHDDLNAQYAKFVVTLENTFFIDAHRTNGLSFTVFKKVFSNAGIALLHTQLTPQRCDPAEYAQLIYAVCFDFLRRAFQTREKLLPLGAFAVFLLYSLYETNPYPNKLSSEIESAPMNLQDPHNPRLTYRRCYRERIRIDLEHFHYLLQLRDIVLEKVSNFQAEMGQLEQTSRITGSLATDTAEVIERLMPILEYCAYTGPSGLEALAGHADYPVPPTAATKKWWNENRKEVFSIDSSPVVPDVPISESYQIPIGLQEQVEHYINLRKNIRQTHSSYFRQKGQFLRKNTASIPFLLKTKTALDELAFVSRTRQPEKKRVKLRHGYVEIPIDLSTRTSRNTEVETKDAGSTQASVLDISQEEAAAQEVHVILPEGLSSVLEESLEDAFEALVQRKAMLPPATVAAHAEEVSTMAKSQTVATSVTGTGRNALRALLQKATSGTLSEGQSTAFLESQDDVVDEDISRNDVVSDISSDDGDVTVAGSTMGRTALRDLLSYATETETAPRIAAKTKPHAKANRTPRKQLKVKPTPRNSSNRVIEQVENVSIASDSSPRSPLDNSLSSGHDTDSDSNNDGRAALKALLARAAFSGN